MMNFLVLFSSCNGGGDGFGELEDTEISDSDTSTSDDGDSSDTATEVVEIQSYIPTESLVILREDQNVTFGVQVNDGAGEVNYKFYVDSSLVKDSNSTFYILDVDDVTAGPHEVKVVATNSLGSDEHIFSTHKNSKPLLSLSSNTSQTINCVSDTFTLSISAVDPDSDTISFSYYLNGNEDNTYLTGSSTASTAQVVFNPICSQSGSNTVMIRATDANGDYSDYSMGVTVTNPNVASIDSYSPTADPVVILSTENKTFLVSTSGNAPMSYHWAISPGSTISSCNDSTSCTIGGGDFSPGEYTLTASVSDSLSTTDTKDFNVVINDRPSVSSSSPSNNDLIKMNCNGLKNFQVQISDQNIIDGQSVSVNWYVDNVANAKLSSVLDTSSHPYVADATFSPSCEESLLGAHKVKVVINDGYENQEMEWSVETNYFSETCNSLDPGEVCTLVGLVGMGSGLDVTSDKDKLRISPAWIEKHPSGGYFFSELDRHQVWFYNPNSTPQTVLGKSVPANSVTALFGQVYFGYGVDGESYTDYYLYNPSGLAYDSSNDVLYVANRQRDRIVKFDSFGVGTTFAGGGTSDTDGTANSNHRCTDPYAIALDVANNKLFATCYGNNGGNIKVFDTVTHTGQTLVRYQNAAAVSGTTTGYSTGTARLGRAYSIVKDPNARILYAADIQKCRIVAISYGDIGSYYGGEITLLPNTMQVLTRNNGCGNTLNRLYTDTGGRIRTRNLAVYEEGGLTKGIFFSNADNSYIGLVNLTTSSITLGGNTIGAKRYHRVWGSSARDYGRGEPAYTSTHGNYPYGLYVDGTDLIVGDSRNGRIARLDISTGNGLSSDIVGNLVVGGLDTDIDKNANLRELKEPQSLAYSESENKVYFVDFRNYRIRSINLTNGRVKTEIGRGVGNSNTDPEDALDAYFRDVYDITVTDDDNFLLYTDYYTTGVNRNCQVRTHNKSSSDQSFWGQLFESKKVRTAAGNYALGCQNWSTSYEGQSAISIPLRYPVGVHVLKDSSSFYISDWQMHCIHKVDGGGNITTPIGSCGTNGNSSGPLATSLVNYPGALDSDLHSSVVDSGNFFIVERSLSNNNKIKYVNLSGAPVQVLGQDVDVNEIEEVLSGVDYVSQIATYEDQICYSQGGRAALHNYPHNVTCLNRDTALTTLRVGRVKSSTFNGATQLNNEEEGALASSTSLAGPWGVVFDSEGNLYISERYADTIRMVKKWW